MQLSARSQGLRIQQGGSAPPDSARPDDVALLLHTSGTTSRPKAVPLSHGNLRASLTNIAGTYQLTGRDRCANVLYIWQALRESGPWLPGPHCTSCLVCQQLRAS